MNIIIIIIALIILALGFIGDFLPILPGPILSYLALLTLQFTDKKPFTTEFLIIFFILTLIITILDYIVPIIGTKKMGGSKQGTKGNIIGLITGTIILPISGITIGPFGLFGLIIGPFFGALIGEKLYNKKYKIINRSIIKPAIGSFLGFISGILLKFIFSIIITLYIFPNIFYILK